MKITLHPDKCISCGLCASIAPALFSVESGKVAFIKDPKTWNAADWKIAKEAAAACPNDVIEIVDEG